MVSESTNGDPAGAPAAPPRPAAWWWFLGFCFVMSFAFIFIAVFGLFLLFLPADLLREFDWNAVAASRTGWFFLAAGLVAHIAYVAPLFFPRRRWAWLYDALLLCASMALVCPLIAAIPLLLFWMKPDTRAYFDEDRA